jgi:hypothetical protein
LKEAFATSELEKPLCLPDHDRWWLSCTMYIKRAAPTKKDR